MAVLVREEGKYSLFVFKLDTFIIIFSNIKLVVGNEEEVGNG